MKNTLMKKILLLSLFIPQVVQAGLQLDKTRYIYQKNSNQEIIISNKSSGVMAAQVWAENQDGSPSRNFLFEPQLFQLEADKKQIVRIVKIAANLPQDKESLFWINVQEIPAATDKNISKLSVSFRHRMKLIYRPSGITEHRNSAASKLTWKKIDNKLRIKNDTPFFFALTEVKVNGELMPINEVPFAPSSVFDYEVGMKKITHVVVKGIDDYGAVKTFDLSKNKG